MDEQTRARIKELVERDNATWSRFKVEFHNPVGGDKSVSYFRMNVTPHSEGWKSLVTLIPGFFEAAGFVVDSLCQIDETHHIDLLACPKGAQCVTCSISLRCPHRKEY